MATGKQQKITITASSGLSDKDIDKLVHEAEEHQAEDKQKREAVELRNRADQLVYTTEKTLAEFRDKLNADDVATLERALRECREAVESNDIDRIRAAMENLTKESHKMAEAMYRQAGGDAGQGYQAGPQPGPGSDPQSGDPDVIDAEFEEKKS
jgi:molecular chaperone DnaK